MKFKFDNEEIVQFDTKSFGKGKGVVVGYCEKSDMYVVYPKVQHIYENYPYMCIMVNSENLVSTPF